MVPWKLYEIQWRTVSSSSFRANEDDIKITVGDAIVEESSGEMLLGVIIR